MYTMHQKQYEFLSPLLGTLFEQPKKGLIRSGPKGALAYVTIMPGRIKVSRSTVMNCVKSGWVSIGTQYVVLTDDGANAICDYRKRFTDV